MFRFEACGCTAQYNQYASCDSKARDWNICSTTTTWPPFDDPSHRRFALLTSKQHWPTITSCSLYVLFMSSVPLDILVCNLEAESLRLQRSTSEVKIWQQCYIFPPELGFASSHADRQGSLNLGRIVFRINFNYRHLYKPSLEDKSFLV
jgi:hypothetical protein